VLCLYVCVCEWQLEWVYVHVFFFAVKCFPITSYFNILKVWRGLLASWGHVYLRFRRFHCAHLAGVLMCSMAVQRMYLLLFTQHLLWVFSSVLHAHTQYLFHNESLHTPALLSRSLSHLCRLNGIGAQLRWKSSSMQILWAVLTSTQRAHTFALHAQILTYACGSRARMPLSPRNMCVRGNVCVFVTMPCVSVCACVCVCITCECVCLWMCVSVSVQARERVCVHIYTNMKIYIYAYIYFCTYMYVYMYICMYV